MLQFCGIDGSLLDYVVDKSAWKQGKLTPGTHIPVHPTEYLLADRPDVLLLSAWNLADEIQRQQDAYVKLGGRLLHPLPMPHYLS
jgi:novobiocin biosynthesis protein NovU/D-mycarose 3-C-methyltransferase